MICCDNTYDLVRLSHKKKKKKKICVKKIVFWLTGPTFGVSNFCCHKLS